MQLVLLHTLKTELIHHEDFQNREEAHQVIFEYKVSGKFLPYHYGELYEPWLTEKSCKLYLKHTPVN